MHKEEKWADFISFDLFGHAYNGKYPPNKDLYGSDYEGYATPNRLTFFFDFCVQQYGIAFVYGKTNFEAEFTEEGPILTNLSTGEVYGPFEDAVQLLEMSEINEKKLIDVIDEIEDVVLH